MQSTNKQIFKIYQDGEDRCAELVSGKFRAIEHKDENLCEVNTYGQKPDRFQQHRTMTLNEICDEGLNDLFEDTIRAKSAMDGATTLKAAAQKLREYANELEKLESQGWQLDHEIEDDYGFIVIDLKPSN